MKILTPKLYTPLRWAAPLLVGALLAALPSSAPQATATESIPSSGIVCTTGTSPNPSFTLTAKEGYIQTPDGNIIYMWGYARGAEAFQYPGPVLCVNQGDTVTVTLNNTLREDSSVIFPGQENVLADGVPAEPQFNGGAITSLTNVAEANGGSITYQFVASEPGTYIYESGTEAGKQVQMGLAGALIVRPHDHPDWAYNRPDTAFNTSTEYLMFLSEIDPNLHAAVERGEPFDLNGYVPRYWMINGRSFPDTIAPNGASWLPDQPYGALAHIHPLSASNPLPGLMRYLNVGTVDYPFHPHGNSARVIARDGRVLEGSAGEDGSYEKFSIPVGPGQTWDATFTWSNVEGWNSSTNPIPVPQAQPQNTTYGPYYSGSPYLGGSGALPTGTENYNQCGEYYHVAHNHSLIQITSYGMTMSGMLTYTRIDPPLPNGCP